MRVIQRFKNVYGLCSGMIERFLIHSSPVEPDERMTFPTLIRTASEMGVLRSEWDV